MEGFFRALGIDPETVRQTGQSIETLTKVLQEIRDAVILQNWLMALHEANERNIDVDNVMLAARELATTTPPPADPA